VVEKCLKLGGAGLNEQRDAVVQELLASPNLGRLLQDAYANYVMQSALTVSSGQLHRWAAPDACRAATPPASPAVFLHPACHLRPACLSILPCSLCSQLVEAIRPHLPALRGTPHGKRILAKVSVKL
jgi:hypothetical protein